MPVLSLHLAQTKYGPADAVAAITVAGVARPHVTVKPTRTQPPHIERIEGTWLPGSAVAVGVSLPNDLYEQGKGDRNLHILKVELDDVDQKITRDVLGAAVVRFEVKVPPAKAVPAPAQPAPVGMSAPGAAEVAALTAKVDASAARLAVIEGLLREAMERQRAADAQAASFYAAVEFVPEGEVAAG